MSGGAPSPGLRLLLYGEMACLYLLPPATRGVPAQLRFPVGSRAWSRGRGGCESRRALGGEGWRLGVPGELCDEPASGGIGLRTLVLLRRTTAPRSSVADAAPAGNMIGQQVVAARIGRVSKVWANTARVSP